MLDKSNEVKYFISLKSQVHSKSISNGSNKSIRIHYVIGIVLRPLPLVLYEYSNQFHTTCGTRPGDLRARRSLSSVDATATKRENMRFVGRVVPKYLLMFF